MICLNLTVDNVFPPNTHQVSKHLSTPPRLCIWGPDLPNRNSNFQTCWTKGIRSWLINLGYPYKHLAGLPSGNQIWLAEKSLIYLSNSIYLSISLYVHLSIHPSNLSIWMYIMYIYTHVYPHYSPWKTTTTKKNWVVSFPMATTSILPFIKAPFLMDVIIQVV